MDGLAMIRATNTIAEKQMDLLRLARPNLIVMGTHGRSELKHLLFYSVAEEAVHRARRLP